MYTYPDINDNLTGELISKVSVNNYWDESEKNVLKMCFEKMTGQGKHLDLGSGQGRLIGPFLSYSSELVAAEPDPSRCEWSKDEAKKLNEESPEKKVTVINGDIKAVISDGHKDFDSILSSHVIQHIPSKMTEDMLKDACSLLKDNGYLFMTCTYNDTDSDRFTIEVFDENGKREVKNVDEDSFGEAFGKTNILPVAFYTKKRVIDLIESFGLSLELIYGYHFYFKDYAVTVEDDIRLNEKKDLSHARDVLYIFRKKH